MNKIRQFEKTTWRSIVVMSLILLNCADLLTGSQAVHCAEIIAHRGASFDAPENTLASVKLAWEQRADAVEIDIYLSKDQRIVVMHDATPKRFGGPDRKLVDMTWDEIQQVDVGRWKNARFAGERVPELEAILKSIPTGRRLFIEVKCGAEIIPILKQVLQKADRPAEQTCIISFHAAVIEAASDQLPHLERYWLSSMGSKDKAPPAAEELMKVVQQTKASGLDLGGNTAAIDAPLLEKLTAAKIPCYAWTVNDPDEARRLAQLGVKGITTDKPQLLRAAGLANEK